MAICENTYDEDGNKIPPDGTDGNTGDQSSCVPYSNPGGNVQASACPDTDIGNTCKPFQLTQNRDACIINDYVDEHLLIGAADLHVFKLLGIHEQNKLIDLTENGKAISSGDQNGFPASEAFTTFVTEWRSAQKGQGVTISGYIGYDFGIIRLDGDGRNRYSVDTAIKHNIATISLKQGNSSQNRATKVRVERSEDNKKWYGAAILTLPDDDCLNTFQFRNTANMRYWRIRAIDFNGGVNDYWAVQSFEMYDYEATNIRNIQDKIWNENRDRDYADETLTIKGSYDIADVGTDLSRFGIELPSNILMFTVSIRSVVAILGRSLVIGDIIEVPSEVQYDVNMNPILQYMEVTDVAWSTEGYTPGWEALLQKVTTQPLIATQETADIFGGLEGYKNTDDGFLENFEGTHGMDDGKHPIFQDQSDVSQTIEETADDQDHLPERGRDPADITQFSERQKVVAEEQQTGGARGLENIGLNPRQLYVEDALPPNGLPYTEGDEFPTNPQDGDYHRLTYTGVDTKIPARLFRFALAKGRWIFMEKDKRSTFSDTKPVLTEFFDSPNRIPAEDIAK